MAPALVTPSLTIISGRKKSQCDDGQESHPTPETGLSASAPSSLSYDLSTTSGKHSHARSVPFLRDLSPTPPGPVVQQTHSSPLVERERRAPLRRSLSLPRLSLVGSLVTSNSTGGRSKKDSDEYRQTHYVLRRLRQEELEQHNYSARSPFSSSSSPGGSPSKSMSGRVVQTDINSGAQHTELARSVSMVAKSSSSLLPLQFPVNTPSSPVDTAGPPSPLPARPLLRSRRSLPLLSGLFTLASSPALDDDDPVVRLQPQRRSSFPFPSMGDLRQKAVDQRSVERLRVSSKVRPAISHPVLINPGNIPWTRLVTLQQISLDFKSEQNLENSYAEEEEQTTQANTSPGAEARISLAEIESLQDIIYTFPSPTYSGDTPPVSPIGFPSLLQLDSSDSSSSSSESSPTSPVGTPPGVGFSFTPIFTAASMANFKDDSRKRHALYDSHPRPSLETVEEVWDEEEGEDEEDVLHEVTLEEEDKQDEESEQRGVPPLVNRGDDSATCTAPAFPIPLGQEKSRGFTMLNAISSISGFSFASFANRLLVESQPQCKVPSYAEDDGLYWPQILAQ